MWSGIPATTETGEVLPPDYLAQLNRYRFEKLVEATCKRMGWNFEEISALGNHLKEKGMV